MTKVNERVKFGNYGHYTGNNYGVNTLYFVDTNNNTFYFSYETLVAFEHDYILYVHENIWGRTTGKHLTWIDGGQKEKRLSKENFQKMYDKFFGE